MLTEEHTLMKAFLESIGYSFSGEDNTTLTNLETGEIADLTNLKNGGSEVLLFCSYQFKNSEITIKQERSSSIKRDYITLYTPEMTYEICFYYYDNSLVQKCVSFSTNTHNNATINFNISNGTEFNTTTKTTIQQSCGGDCFPVFEIVSDLTQLKLHDYARQNRIIFPNKMDISGENYFHCLRTNLNLIFGPHLSRQAYHVMYKVLSSLSDDNVRIMLDLPITNAQAYLKSVEYDLSQLTGKYKYKFGQLLSEMEDEKKTLEEYKALLESPGIKK